MWHVMHRCGGRDDGVDDTQDHPLIQLPMADVHPLRGWLADALRPFSRVCSTAAYAKRVPASAAGVDDPITQTRAPQGALFRCRIARRSLDEIESIESVDLSNLSGAWSGFTGLTVPVSGQIGIEMSQLNEM